MVEDNESEALNKAAEKIIEIYSKNKNNEILKEMLDYEKDVIDKWSKYFNPDNIDNLNKEAFNFFKRKENHHWTNIQRKRNSISLEQFKEGLKILLDDSKDVGERLKDATEKVKYFGKAMATPILLVHNVEKYGVWNDTSESALRYLDLWKWKNDEDMKSYSEINETLIKLKDKVREINSDQHFDLWKLDGVFHVLMDSHWWIEKTREFGHNKVQGIENAEFGKSLYSPQKDKWKGVGRDYYKNMTKIEPNDLIIHLNLDNNSFVGISKAASKYKEIKYPDSENPNRLKEGYQVELKEYVTLERPVKWDEVKKNNEENLKRIRNKNYNLFYEENLRIHEGTYITKAPLEFVKILNNVYKNSTGQDLPYFNDNPTDDKNVNKMVPKNIILNGPVGTGKTYISDIIAQKIVDNGISSIKDIEDIIKSSILNAEGPDKNYTERIKKITFHKSYSYEDFIVGIKAVSENGNISYQVEDGIFKEFCDEAAKHSNQNYVFIIDEINRGDISRIFGELITLIEEDKRGKKIKLPLKKDKQALDFSVPDNLYIIGTMNDSDRNIALIDVALRRRFTFFRIGFNEYLLSQWLNGLGDESKNKIMKFVKYLNHEIKTRMGEDYEIGHAFFAPLDGISGDDAKNEVYTIFKYRIFPLLEEYFHSDREILTEFLKEFYESDSSRKNENDRIPIIKAKEFKDFNGLMSLIEKTLENGQ